jgi:hypothetical protein
MGIVKTEKILYKYVSIYYLTMIHVVPFSNWLIGVIMGVVLLIKANELCVFVYKGIHYNHYELDV